LLYALVNILNAPYHIDKPYTYHLPAQLEKKVAVGSVVVVPFGGANKQRCGIVTDITDKCEYGVTKPVLGVPGKYMYVGGEAGWNIAPLIDETDHLRYKQEGLVIPLGVYEAGEAEFSANPNGGVNHRTSVCIDQYFHQIPPLLDYSIFYH